MQSVAEALVRKHPCLTERGSRCGYVGWKIKLKFKMGNYRTDLRKEGVLELIANKRGGKPSSNMAIKKPRRAEVNFLPLHLDGETDETLEEERESLLNYKQLSKQVINEKMTKTFSLRRKVIVRSPPVVEVIQKWPVLFETDQVSDRSSETFYHKMS